MTTLAIGVLAFFVGWLLGRIYGYRQIIEATNVALEEDSWAEAQRSVSPWQ